MATPPKAREHEVNQCSGGPEATNHRREGGIIRVLGQRALNHGKQRWIWAPGGATPSFPPRQMADWGGGAKGRLSWGHGRRPRSQAPRRARLPSSATAGTPRPPSEATLAPHASGPPPSPSRARRAGIRLVPPHERGFLTKGQAWVSQMLPGGKSGVLTEACRAAGASRWHRPPRAPAASRRVLSAARWQATRLHVPPPHSSLWHWGAVGPSRHGGGGGSGRSTPPRECQPPIPVVTLVVTGVGL